VLEDDFAAGRPHYEDVGAQVVDDVHPYEVMKLRLLNGSHQGLAYFGTLTGHHFVHEAAQDPVIATLLRRYMVDEATPTLRPLPGIDVRAYRDSVIARFSNAHVADTIARVATDTSDRIPKFVLPVVAEQLAANRPVTLSAAIVASWARYARGVADDGSPIEVVDRVAPQLVAAAKDRDPRTFLHQRDLFGALGDDPRFVDPFLDAWHSIARVGTRETVVRLTQSG